MDQDPRREQLHEILVGILGTRNVYFQPPSNTVMTYPCIVYSRDSAFESHADNRLYRFKQRYQVTVIDRNPDSSIPGKIRQLPECSYERFFTADNLNHDVYNLFF